MVHLFLCVTLSHGKTAIYVSQDGNDTNNGTVNAPFSSIHRAQTEVRTLRQSGDKGTIEVIIREGVYRFENPLILDAADSGFNDAPTVYKPYQNESVVFRGSKLLNSVWEKYNDAIWVSSAKLETENGFSERSLFIDNHPYTMARYPNATPGLRPFEGVAADCLAKERVARWQHPETGYVHGMQHGKWGSVHYKIDGVKDGYPHLSLVSIDTSTMYNNAQLHKTERYVENIFEELDSPGEWFWDRDSNRLYVYPAGNIDLSKAQVEIPWIDSIILFKGNREQPVKNVRIESIQFRNTKSTWFKTTEHLPLGDYIIHRGAVVMLEGTENCVIDSCSFNNMGGNAVMLSNYNNNSQVKKSRFSNIQANAIVMVGSRDAMRDSPWCEVTEESRTEDLVKKWGYWLTYKVWKKPLRESRPSTDTSVGPKTDNFPQHCLIEDNLVTRAGELEKQAAGILLSMCGNNRINHNSVFDLPRAGICINDGCWGGNVIENNDVFHTVLSTADHGPFNSWGRDRHWTMQMHGPQKKGDENALERSRLDCCNANIIRHNYFRHTINTHSWGIDLDDGSSNYIIENNLTVGCAIKLREGFFRRVENNIVISKYPLGKHVCFDKSQDVIRRNIYVNPEGDLVFEGIFCKPASISEIDYNVYYTMNQKHPMVLIRGYAGSKYQQNMSLNTWQEEGYDLRSIAADPLFVDFETENFKLKDNSPAFSMGFVEFDLTNFGSRVAGFKEETRQAHKKFDQPIKETQKKEIPDGKLTSWMGASIKSMETEMEKSAAGTGDIAGVILVNVPKNSRLAKSGARTGDVILMAEGIDIKDIKDLAKVISSSKGSIKVWVDGNPPAKELTITNPDMLK